MAPTTSYDSVTGTLSIAPNIRPATIRHGRQSSSGPNRPPRSVRFCAYTWSHAVPAPIRAVRATGSTCTVVSGGMVKAASGMSS